jgi:hypothetical protein
MQVEVPCIWPLLADRRVALLTQPRKDMSDYFLEFDAFTYRRHTSLIFDFVTSMMGIEICLG